MTANIPGYIQVELPLISADSSRPPIFPFIVCTTCADANEFDFLADTSVTVHLPDAAQLNANGGLKKLVQDVTATYHRDWTNSGSAWIAKDAQRRDMTRASMDMMSGISQARHDHERLEGFEGHTWWRRCAEAELGIMVRHMVWWRTKTE
ncbi:hypothetical protein OHC33_004444 [Knufia fluminis]|uniref:Uncharacterized protein n=1 Tax=Knufia fluminis TaxID=191047 RepID=A0AAN8ERV9_9EURO|nr:hypothetical protein OHC33_004444 [Knufia fluminis]